jgi:hypothetical protein
MFGGRLHNRAADALGLEERPQVRGLDILADGFGLRALAELSCALIFSPL